MVWLLGKCFGPCFLWETLHFDFPIVNLPYVHSCHPRAEFGYIVYPEAVGVSCLGSSLFENRWDLLRMPESWEKTLQCQTNPFISHIQG